MKNTAFYIVVAMVVTSPQIFAVQTILNPYHCAEIKLGTVEDYYKTSQILLVNPDAWGADGVEKSITYRQLKLNKNAEFFIVAFDTDKTGFCQHDIIMEIFFRDDVKHQKTKERFTKGRIKIESRIDFISSPEYAEIGHLECEGDGKWKSAYVFMEQTPRQLIRAIDGSFQFRFVTADVAASKSVAVSYIKLMSVNHHDFQKLRENDRIDRGLVRVDYVPPSKVFPGSSNIKSKGIVAYPVNYLKLVFPNSPVEYDKISQELRCFEIAGEAEPLSFVIHTFERFHTVRARVSDLRCENDIIPSNKIEIRKVVYNDQRWGWLWVKEYGICPDYLSPPDPVVDIPGNSNCQFWLTINVPKDAKPGIYTGDIIITSQAQPIANIPLTVEVMPVTLLANNITHMLYHSPFYRNFDKDPLAVLIDMKNHGLQPIFYPKGRLIETRTKDLTVNLDGFDYELTLFRQVYPHAKTIFVGLFDYFPVWSKLKGPKPEFQYNFPQFEKTYGAILKKYAETAEKFGLEIVFSFSDEPGAIPEKRRPSYLCSLIAKNAGLKTWCGTYFTSDKQLPLSELEKQQNINYLRPLSDVLDVFNCSLREVNKQQFENLLRKNVTPSYSATGPASAVYPVYNRFLQGIYPFAVSAKYVLTYAYRDAVLDPYDDMDVPANYANRLGVNDFLLTYPTWTGHILPTLSYEALREGVEDSQIISTFQKLIKQASDSDDPKLKKLAEQTSQYLNGILNRVSMDFSKYFAKHEPLPVDPMEQAILYDLNNAQSRNYEIFNIIRRQLCDKIIVLQNSIPQ